jgi:DHA1 family bicyclomycin/chloramphenicol resistance-like MFS transporter
MLTAFGALSTDMYLPGLPTIARELHTDVAAAQQTLAVFFLGMALGQVLYGPISDRLGRRRPLLFGCALYALAGIGCALAPSIQSLVALRFVQALGACAGTVIGRSIVRDLFDQRESARMYSLLMLMMGVAPITAPSIGGQILVALGWRAIFLALSGFGFACVAAVLCGLSETLPPERRARSRLGAAFRTYSKLFIDRRYMGFTVASALAIGSMFAYIVGSPFVFIELHGVRPDRYGLLFGTNAVGLVLASQFNRWLLRRYSSLAILRTGLAIMGASGLLLATITAVGVGSFPGMLALLFSCVASNGLVQPNAIALAMAPHGRQAGSASALLGAFQMATAAAVGALIGLLHNGTALPMVGVIATCVTAAFLILQWVTPLHAFRSSPI